MRRDELLAVLRAEAAATLGFDRPEDVSTERSLFDSGLDSLMAAELAQRLQKRLGLGRASLVFEHPSLDALATRIESEMVTARAVTPSRAPVPAAALASTSVEAEALPDGPERSSRLEQIVREDVAATLGFETAAQVPADRSFTELGMDSLMAAELSGRLRKRLGLRQAGVVFDYPTVSALTAHLVSQGESVGRGVAVLEPARVLACAGNPFRRRGCKAGGTSEARLRRSAGADAARAGPANDRHHDVRAV